MAKVELRAPGRHAEASGNGTYFIKDGLFHLNVDKSTDEYLIPKGPASPQEIVSLSDTEYSYYEAPRRDFITDHRVNPSPHQIEAARFRAVKLYPELGRANSPLNREFIRRYNEYQTTKKAFFSNPEWPTILAKECDTK